MALKNLILVVSILLTGCESREWVELSAPSGQYSSAEFTEFLDEGSVTFTSELLQMDEGEQWTTGTNCGLMTNGDRLQIFFAARNQGKTDFYLMHRIIENGFEVNNQTIRHGLEWDSPVSGTIKWFQGNVEIVHQEKLFRFSVKHQPYKFYCSVTSGRARFDVKT